MTTTHAFQQKQALKISLAIIIDILIVNVAHLKPLMFIAPISSLVIMTIFQNQTLSHGIERCLGPLLVTALIAVTMPYFMLPMVYYIVTIVILMCCGYLFAMENHGYAALMGGIIGAVVLTEALNAPSNALTIGYYFCLQSAIGVVIAWAVTFLIFPVRPKTHLTPGITQLFHQLAMQWQHNTSLPLDNLTKQKQYLAHCRAFMSNEAVALYQHHIVTAKLYYLKNDELLEKYNHAITNPDFAFIKTELQACADYIQQAYNSLANGIAKHQVIDHDSENVHHTIDIINQKLHFLRQQPISLATRDTIALLSLTASLKAVCHQLATHIKQHNLFVTDKLQPDALKSLLATKKETLLPLNKTGLKHAFRITLTIMVMLLLHRYFTWFGGIQAIITSAVIAAQPNMGRAKHRLILRAAGIVIGGCVGLVLLAIYAHVPIFYLYLAMMFIISLVFGYYSIDSERISYASLQALIIILLITTTITPAGNITMGIHRFIGVIEGGLIGILITRFIFPVHAKKQLHQKLAKGFRHCAQLYLDAINNHCSEQHIREKMREAFTGNKQLLIDIYDENKKNNKDYLAEASLVLQKNLESLYALTQSIRPIPKSILTRLSKQTADINTSYQQTAEAIAHNRHIDVNACRQLAEQWLGAIDTIRKEQITKDYALEELEKCMLFFNCSYDLASRLISLATMQTQPDRHVT